MIAFRLLSTWNPRFLAAIRAHYTKSDGPPPGKKLAWEIHEDGAHRGWIGLGEPAFKLAARLRADVIWSKANPMPESVRDRPTKAHEYLFLLTKSEQYFYDADAIREPQVAPEASTPGDVARAFSRRRAAAVDPRQEALGAPRRRSGNKTRSQRIDAGGAKGRNTNQSFGIPWEDTDGLAGGLVLDPFGGSGTVGEVAEALGRRWMLLELNPAYAELARARAAQRGLFGDAAAAALAAGGAA